MFLKLSQCEDPSHCQSKSSFQKQSEKYTDNTKADTLVKSSYTDNTKADTLVKSSYTDNTKADTLVKSRLMWIE